MFVKPGMWADAPEDAPRQLLVRHPNRTPLRAEGEEVPDTMYWHRRLRDGDVVLAGAPAEKIAKLGEPMRLTAAEWLRVGDAKIEPPSGEAEMGFAIGEAEHERDPDAPLLTHDEYLAGLELHQEPPAVTEGATS
jgi:hypothetical protein